MAPSPQDLVCTTCGATLPANPNPNPDSGAHPDPGADAAAGDAAAADALAVARLTCTRGTERGETVWTCERCSRAHLRSIEAKLDQAWW